MLSVLLRTGAPLTGRQVHALVSDEHSLWSVQESLTVLTRLGIVDTQTIGRAGVHTINDGHAVVAHLRVLADPIGMLRAAIAGAVGSGVESVIVFGSIARGQASRDSDIDLAVIASPGWDGRADLATAARGRVNVPAVGWFVARNRVGVDQHGQAGPAHHQHPGQGPLGRLPQVAQAPSTGLHATHPGTAGF